MKVEIRDESYTMKMRPTASITDTLTSNSEVLHSSGVLHFDGGTVTIYQSDYHESDDKYVPFVSLSFYTNGRGYHRTITGKRYTHLGLARKAGEFARGVIIQISEERAKQRFSDRLVVLRKMKGLSVEELSARSGISESMINYYESSPSNPSIDEVSRLAEGLRMKIETFFI